MQGTDRGPCPATNYILTRTAKVFSHATKGLCPVEEIFLLYVGGETREETVLQVVGHLKGMAQRTVGETCRRSWAAMGCPDFTSPT